MAGRTLTATSMAFTDQRRRPLLLLLLVIVPAYVITFAIATTLATPRRIGLPGGLVVDINLRQLHGAVMAGDAIAFVAALCGAFVMQAALQGDRRLVIAGFRPVEAVVARLVVLGAATVLVVGVSMGITAVNFTPVSWLPFAGAALLTGIIYAAIGALAGALLDKLSATYLVLFFALTDLGIIQNPMFGDGTPGPWAALLPGYGPGRMMVDGAFSPSFHAAGPLAIGLGWAVGLTLTVGFVLRRAVGTRR